MVLAEGMAMKKPVISYAVGGTPEAIEHGINGFLVSSGKANEMMNLLINYITIVNWAKHWGKMG